MWKIIPLSFWSSFRAHRKSQVEIFTSSTPCFWKDRRPDRRSTRHDIKWLCMSTAWSYSCNCWLLCLLQLYTVCLHGRKHNNVLVSVYSFIWRNLLSSTIELHSTNNISRLKWTTYSLSVFHVSSPSQLSRICIPFPPNHEPAMYSLLGM